MSKYIIEVEDNAVANGCYQIVGTNNVLVTPNGLDELEKYEEAVEEQTHPKIGDEYWVITGSGNIFSYTYEDCEFDNNCLNIGNFFKSKEEAEFALERLKVLAEMKKFAESFDMKFDYSKRHYYMYYNSMEKHIGISKHTLTRSGELYFESEEKIRECIEVVGEDRIKKYYLGVE